MPVPGKDLPVDHWHEAATHLGEERVGRTRWELTTVAPDEIWNTLILPFGMGPTELDRKEFDEDVESLAEEIRDSHRVRPIMVDEIRPGAPWVEGLHRIAAATLLHFPSIPAYVRIK